MTIRFHARLLRPQTAAVVLFSAQLGLAVQASDQHWNLDGTGGTGNWSAGPADKNWNSALGAAGANYAWPDAAGDIAVFADGLGGTVTVFGTVQTSGISLSGADYGLEGGEISLLSSAGAPTLDAASGTLRIGASLLSADGFDKTGAGTVILSGLNTVAGDVRVQAGTLKLGAADVLSGPVDVLVSAGATLDTGSAAQTVNRVTADGGTLAGSGLLAAAEYDLANGASVTGNLGAGTLKVTSGSVTLTGTSAAGEVDIAGTLHGSGNNLADTAAVVLGIGSEYSLSGDETVGSLVANGGSITGTATLTAGSYALNQGATVSGHLGNGDISVTGGASISGSTGNGKLEVISGTLDFTGVSGGSTVTVAAGATLNHGGDFTATPEVVNSGTVRMDVADTVASYRSEGGTLSGTGTLTAATYDLLGISVVSGRLGAGTLTSSGMTTVTGSVDAGEVRLLSGTLTNTGTLGTAASHINLAAGTTLVASGIQQFQRLTTAANGTATWQGNLTNVSTVAPGDTGGFGTLQVTGNFTNTAAATLSLDLGAAGHDLLRVSGTAVLGGTLDLHQTGAEQIPLFTPVQVIGASAYASNFDAISEDVDGEVFFNPLNGDVTRLSFQGDSSLLRGLTRNQASSWLALYDDVVDPGIRNVSPAAGSRPPFNVTGGIADASHPTLLNVLAASIAPDGLSKTVLDRMSPEVYASLSDYALQATRSYERAALSTEGFAVAPATPAHPPQAKDAKGAEVAAPAPATSQWEIFAAADYFNVATTNSVGHADYELSGTGFVAGARVQIGNRYRVTGYLAGDDGKIQGSLIDADGNGWAVGVLGEAIIEEAHATKVTAGISYGSYSFDGRRSTLGASGSGVAPASAFFSGVNTQALEFSLGVESTVYHNSRLRLIPSASLRYSTGSTDSFREAGRGDTLTLGVGDIQQDSLLADFALRAETDITPTLMLTGDAGVSADLDDSPIEISARYNGGTRGFQAQAGGISDNLLHLGLSADWKATDRIGVRLAYRVEFRDGADMLNEVNIGTRFSF